MTKITINPQRDAATASAEDAYTPTQAILRKEASQVDVTDARGRILTLKKPDVLAQFDLIEALGDLAKNDVYRIMCIPAIYVVAIDGSPAPSPSNREQMRALISRLGEEGFEAIKSAIDKHWGAAEDGGDESVKK
ncbi:hypothetical protein [Paraburkholderia tropica]|uniref:hypothetical protein n=1 Tax=Paraburkholderia tropica TaxID=92647 RepID=UPI001F297D31|nr:hypothetical protein [Paraburkholderia tropica]